jgi:hypothetical protein
MSGWTISPTRWHSGMACLLILILGFGGCGLFDTREPEPPTTGSSTFIPPTAPEIVLSNLEHAVAEINTENYIRCMVDTLNSERRFLFIPTTPAAGRYAGTFADWSMQSERSWFSAMKAFAPRDASASLTLLGSFLVTAADSALYEGRYEMTWRHGVSNVSETVQGTLQFIMHTDRNSIWSITRWTDISLPDATSWSEWKGRFAN